MKKLMNSMEDIIKLVIGILLCLLVIVVTYIALSRYLLKTSPAWGESTALVIMVWFSFLSSALGVKESIHLRLTLFDELLSEKILNLLDHLKNILWIIFGALSLYYGTKLTTLSSANIITGIGLPASIIYAAIPVFGLIVIIASIYQEVELCKQR